MDYTQDTELYSKVTELMDKLEKNQQLQQLAYENGIDTKNTVKLTAATKENIAVSVVALLLAKRNGDSRYRDLVRYGMDHRKTKMDIINDYKTDANALITRYKNGERPNETVTITTIQTNDSIAESYQDFLNSNLGQYYLEATDHYYSEGKVAIGAAITLGGIIWLVTLPFRIIIAVLKAIVGLIMKIINAFHTFDVDKELRRLESVDPKDREMFAMELKGSATGLTLVMESAAVQELVDKFGELSRETHDITTIKIDKWRELYDLAEAIEQGKKAGEFANKVTKWIGMDKSHLLYDEVRALLLQLKAIDITAFKKNVKEFNAMIDDKKRELKKAEAEAKASGGVSVDNSKAKSEADEVSRIGNKVLSVTQKWSSETINIMKTAKSYVYSVKKEGATEQWRRRDEIKHIEQLTGYYMYLRESRGLAKDEAKSEMKKRFPEMSDQQFYTIAAEVDRSK